MSVLDFLLKKKKHNTPALRICWVVCLNDFPEFVITENEEEANKAKNKIRDLEYNGKYKTQYTYEEYKHRFFWHVRTIKIFNKAEEV